MTETETTDTKDTTHQISFESNLCQRNWTNRPSSAFKKGIIQAGWRNGPKLLSSFTLPFFSPRQPIWQIAKRSEVSSWSGCVTRLEIPVTKSGNIWILSASIVSTHRLLFPAHIVMGPPSTKRHVPSKLTALVEKEKKGKGQVPFDHLRTSGPWVSRICLQLLGFSPLLTGPHCAGDATNAARQDKLTIVRKRTIPARANPLKSSTHTG